MRVVATLLGGLLLSAACATHAANAPSNAEPTRYLAFQIFRVDSGAAEMSANIPPSEDLLTVVRGLRDRIGMTGSHGRKLGFIIGPISFDTPDDAARATIRQMFDVSLRTGVAGGIHIDDSMFWGRLTELNSIDSIEWLDWKMTPNTGRRLDWSSHPTKIMPQLCINSARVRNAVAARAALIGDEVAKGVAMLHAAGKDDLFVGVIAGWETQIGRDFDTGKSLGYCALTNAGFSVKHPPPDRDRELSTIIEAFAGYWAQSLVRAGVPKGKVYSHIAFMSNVAYEISRFANPGQPKRPYLESINFTPPSTAFCADCIPGFSTYPQPGHLEQLQTELKLHGNAEWASSEGTAIDPAIAERDGGGVGMETYLGDLFNNGARLVNVFGWDVGPPNNPFRRIAQGDDAVAAYRKFLTGQNLREAAIPIPKIPPADLPDKIHRIQSQLPGWIAAHGTATVKPLMEQLQGYLQQQQFDQASKTADQILKLLGSR